MSEDQTAHHTKNEIIIVKRRGGDDHDGHHGGVWKIAYADFMTAMMAFFLVMWLINAANDQTKASVASYFNPIKLVDQRPSDKGIKDNGHATKQGDLSQKSKSPGTDQSAGEGGQSGHQQVSTAGDKTEYSEADYFKNPYSVLSEIAEETGQKANVSAAGQGGAQTSGPATGASGGKAYRDPFDPDFWTQQVQTVPGKQIAEKDVATPIAGSTASGSAAQAAESSKDDAAGGNDKQDVAEKPASAAASGDGKAKATTGKDANSAGAARSEDAAKAEKLKDEIKAATAGVVGRLAQGISVKPAEGGMLVSITDRVDDGMFNLGSAVPSHDMVIAMQKIGEVLAKRGGPVLISGYTDARPFKGGDYDNWRLSTARAQSAYYMLVRGGLDKTRVVQISGFADRHLLEPDKPYAAANRRIEILVKSDGAGQ